MKKFPDMLWEGKATRTCTDDDEVVFLRHFYQTYFGLSKLTIPMTVMVVVIDGMIRTT